MNNQELLEKYTQYLTARGLSLNYRNIMRIWLAYMEEKKIEVITQETITKFFIENSKYKDNSKCMFIKAGRNYYTGFLQIPKEQNEWHKIKLLKVPRKIAEYFTEKDLEEAKKQLVIYHSNKMTPLKIRTILDFLYYSGVRKNELLTLKRKDIDLSTNTAKVWGKGDKERIICYPEKVKKELEQFFVSCNEEDNAFNLKLGQLHYLIKLINKYSGGNKIHVHSFRHGFAKNALRKGVPLPTVSRLLGHASILTTMIYANPSDDEMKETYQEVMNKKELK
jgi:site-specific recombinase XerD